MEDVEGLMRGLKLSAAERRGLKIGETEKGKACVGALDDPQAVGKLFSEKPVHAGVVGQTLGRIWCPIKGLGCKELEANVFLFTFRQAAGWRGALEEGPWWFDKELLVMEEFDSDKKVDEYEFKLIPMWIRVFRLPLGQMNRATGERIRADFHELVDVDVGPDGKAVGKYVRVKVKLNITEPLMRGFVLDRDNNEEEKTGREAVGWGRSSRRRRRGYYDAATKSSGKDKGGEETEVTSQLKIAAKGGEPEVNKTTKCIHFTDSPTEQLVSEQNNMAVDHGPVDKDQEEEDLAALTGERDAMVNEAVELGAAMQAVGLVADDPLAKGKSGKKFKWKSRSENQSTLEILGVKLGKREGEEMDVDEGISAKKGRGEGNTDQMRVHNTQVGNIDRTSEHTSSDISVGLPK
ncbi:hypothetical protein D1007_31188 [Hordeum vulgare]|nr:hypothetical protein D1007_31188 [Hordeum vulgare]